MHDVCGSNQTSSLHQTCRNHRIDHPPSRPACIRNQFVIPLKRASSHVVQQLASAKDLQQHTASHLLRPGPITPVAQGCGCGMWMSLVVWRSVHAFHDPGVCLPHDNKPRRSMNKQHRSERPPRSFSFVISSSATGVQPYCSCGDFAKFPVGEPGRKSTSSTVSTSVQTHIPLDV
jgi:hypothetical protein